MIADEDQKTKLVLTYGQVYRAKNPANASGYVNDRQIRYINETTNTIQYDGPAVARGRHYPKITIEAFLKWAARDVTDTLPEADWQPWDFKNAKANK